VTHALSPTGCSRPAARRDFAWGAVLMSPAPLKGQF
jgi:hypothetical protein